MRICSNCGAPLDDDAIFCTECGTKAEMKGKVCPNCGSSVDDDSLFCTVCGTKLDMAQNLPTEPVIVETEVIEQSESIIDLEETSWIDENKNWLYPVAGVAALTLIIWGVVSFFGLGSKGNNLLPVQKPAWEKFVVVLNDEVPVYKEPNTISPQLQVMRENVASDCVSQYFKWSDTPDKRGYSSYNYTLYGKRIVPVIAEEGAWYKVAISADEVGMIDGYIQMTHCREVKPEPITQELLQKLRTYYWHDASFGLLTEGKYKNLCFVSSFSEIDGCLLYVAVLYDGVLINPLTRYITAYANGDDNLYDVISSDDNEMPSFRYGKKLQGADGWLDAQQIVLKAKSGELDLSSLIESIPTYRSPVQEVSYYFPNVDEDNIYTFLQDVSDNQSSGGIDGVEDKNFTGFTYVIDNGEFGYELFAEANDEKKTTGISGSQVDILDQADYDGDGELEAVVYAWGGGNSIEPPFIVYFDKETQEFKKAEGFNDASESPKVKVEKWKGKSSFRVDVGLRKDRYVYQDHSVVLAECIVPDVGVILSTITVDQLFGSSEEPEDKTANIDIDGDGEKDKVVFFHDTSHFLGWGKQMMLKDFTGSYWYWPDAEREDMGIIGSKFAFIKPEFGEIPNILTDDAWFYKWIDGKYVMQ